MDEDELQDDQLDTDGDNQGDDSESDNSAPPTNTPPPKGEGKRISDLMSNWQKAEARATKAETALAARDGGAAAQGDDQQGDATNARISEYEEFARANARSTLFGSDPQLAEAGLVVDDIAGSTLAEMRASMQKHQQVIGGIEGRLRNKILSEHGLDPEVATGQGTEKPVSFSTMTDKQFNDYLAERDSRPR